MNSRPWNENRGRWNVIMGPSNVIVSVECEEGFAECE